MTKNVLWIACSTAIIAVLTMGCSNKPAAGPVTGTQEVKPEKRNAYYGFWEAKNRKGETYHIRFTNSEWESHIEKDGQSIPDYKGTYTVFGTRIEFMITEQADLKTMGWVTQKGNLGPNLKGRIEGGKLKIEALTDAELVKKR